MECSNIYILYSFFLVTGCLLAIDPSILFVSQCAIQCNKPMNHYYLFRYTTYEMFIYCLMCVCTCIHTYVHINVLSLKIQGLLTGVLLDPREQNVKLFLLKA